ncbi:MAG: cytochrome c [Polyangiaceae bacterium]
MVRADWLWATALAACAVACGGGSGATDASIQQGKDMAATGALLYERNCQGCHGERGEGADKGPAIFNKKKLGRRFKTAQGLFDFLVKEMPKDNPGSLDIGQYWNIETFIVVASGRKLEERLSEANAEDVKLDK